MELFAGIDPLPIKVHACEITSVVAIDHTIDVQHRHNFENEVLTEYLSYGRIADEEVDDVFDKVGSHTLSGMHPRSQEYTFLFFPVGEVSDDHVIAVITGYGLTQSLPLESIFQTRVALQCAEVLLKLSIGVRVAMCDIHRIVIIRKL